MITNQIDASAVLVTIEGMNANIKKPGVAMYISLNSQNQKYQMEQFVVRKGLQAKTLADLKGKKIMSAPGPANVTMAKAALAAAGLKDGDYTIDQLDMGQHVNAMTAGTFDAGYTLEPNASTMRKMGVATTLEAGVIARYVLGDPNANAFVGRLRVDHATSSRAGPDVAKRFTAAWAKAVDLINNNPTEARKHLIKNTFTPDDVVDTVPMIRYFMAKDLTAKDKADYQKFIDFSVKIGHAREAGRRRPSISRRSDRDDPRAAARSGLRSGAPPGGAPPTPAAAPHVTVRGLIEALRQRQDRGLRPLRPRHSARQARLGVRPERLRQEHADQHDRRA